MIPFALFANRYSKSVTMKKLLIIISLLTSATIAAANPALQKWAKVSDPAPARDIAQSIGDYTAGCIRGAVSLPFRGEGYQVMRLSRKRYYGHPDLIQFIENMGREAMAQGWGTLLIGDLGQPRGGPTLTGHRSHQTGLDVDIWYLISQKATLRSLTMEEREKWSAPSMVRTAIDRIDDAQWTTVYLKRRRACRKSNGFSLMPRSNVICAKIRPSAIGSERFARGGGITIISMCA